MPFHVRITRRSYPSRDETKLDLSQAQLEQQFLQPYREGRPIVIGGMTVPSDDIERMRITETPEPAEQVLRRLRAHPDSAWLAASVGEDWSIADSGSDVSDEYVTAPPGSETSRRESGAPIPREADPQAVFVVHGRNAAARDGYLPFFVRLD